MAEGDTWDEVLASYEHPYRRWMPVAYRTHHVAGWVAAAVAFDVGAAVLDVVRESGAPEALTRLALLASASVLIWIAYVSMLAAGVIRERTTDWRVKDTSELARV